MLALAVSWHRPHSSQGVDRRGRSAEKLYNTITTSILNPDGSTKIDPSAKQRDAVSQELKAYRLKAARVHLLSTAISTAVPSQIPKPTNQEDEQQPRQRQNQHRRLKSRSQPQQSQSQSQAQSQSQMPQTPSLPPDLLELLVLIPPFLNNASTLPPSSVALLLSSPPVHRAPPRSSPRILELVSARLTAQAKTLARVLSPSTNPILHPPRHPLPTLHSERSTATTTLTRHLAQHTEALALLVGALETKHGLVARSSELHAEGARQDAHAWALATEALLWETRLLAYPPEARAALITYRQHLQDAGRRLEDAAHIREVELADYGVDLDKSASRDLGNGARVRGHRRRATVDENKERTMREMARVWREMETRLHEIQGDLNRLR
ncbi:hypothetical protein CIB48_g5950 [Xylaria polymorpha]|nr:hypothetical protein CIB48_g5950 [Xylaria polymorpha]